MKSKEFWVKQFELYIIADFSLVLLCSVTGLSLWGSIVSVGVVVTFYTSLVSLHCSYTSGIRRFFYKKPFCNTIYMYLVASIIIIVDMLNY